MAHYCWISMVTLGDANEAIPSTASAYKQKMTFDLSRIKFVVKEVIQHTLFLQWPITCSKRFKTAANLPVRNFEKKARSKVWLKEILVCAAYHDIRIRFALSRYNLFDINRSYRYIKQSYSEPYTDVIPTKTTADKISMLSIWDLIY